MGTPTGSRVGQALSDLFGRTAVQARTAALPAEMASRERFFRAFMERGERALAEPLRGLIDELLSTEDLPDAYREIFSRIRGPGGQFDFLYTVAAVLSFLLSAAFQVGQPLVQAVLNEIWSRHPNMPVPPSQAAELAARHLTDVEEAKAEARRGGVDDRRFELLTELARARLPVGEVLEARRRGLITEAEARERLRLLGFQDRDMDIFFKPPSGTSLGGLVNVVPTLSDFVTWAVREIFEPDERARLGIDAEFPPEMAAFARQIGLSEEFARNYWAAHWDLPSLTQGFEMFHRGVITRDDLEGLFRAVEIPPLWRDRLLQIAYVPFTRVDVRRMRAAGVIGPEDVVRAYMDLGYDEPRARKLAEWTEREFVLEERQLTKGEIVALYREGLIERGQAQGFLQELGYQADAAEMVLSLADAVLARQRVSASVQVVRSRFVNRRIDRPEAATLLDRLGVRADRRDELLALWEAEREATVRLPTEAQLAAALRRGLIDRETYVRRLIELGYDAGDADLLAALRLPSPETGG